MSQDSADTDRTGTNRPKRPLSPHLQIYRLPMLAVLSISHRATGVALMGGLFLVSLWLIALALGPGAYAIASLVLDSWIGWLIWMGFLLSLFYHLFNGIRHLVWDYGHGLTNEAADRSGILVLCLTAIALLVTIFSVAF